MHSIVEAIQKAERSIAILIDPEKTSETDFPLLHKRMEDFFTQARHLARVKNLFLFVGGSTMEGINLDMWLLKFGKHTKIPIVIFPGSHHQLSEEAQALLFLNLLSGNNPDYLIGQQRQAAALLKNTKLEIIPTAYLLINGSTVSDVQRVSGTVPLSQDDVEFIVNTSYAGELMGNKLVYLEAGSGAKRPVNPEIIIAVSAQLQIPVIVGGGIRDFATINLTFEAGASVVVIGNAFEDDKFNYEH